MIMVVIVVMVVVIMDVAIPADGNVTLKNSKIQEFMYGDIQLMWNVWP